MKEFIIAIVALILICAGIHFFIFEPIIPDDFKVIDGELIDYEIVEDKRGMIDYYILTFNGSEPIKVNPRYSQDMDFTVNSKLVIEMYKDKDATIWDIVSISKFPELR